MTQKPVAGDPRYHALDAVRAFALLLGVVFHAAESFGHSARYYWAIGDNSSSVSLEIFRHASHSFRLELFFLIAGFFAHLVWQRRGIRSFVRNRAGRVLVPLAVGWVVLYPFLAFTWLTGAAKSGQWDIAGVPAEFRNYAPWQLTLGFFLSLQFLRKFDLTHLWFLYQLLVLYAGALALRWVLRRWWSGAQLEARLDQGFRVLVQSRFKVLWFAALALPAVCMQSGWGVDTPKDSLIPEVPATLLFALFFGAGWALHRQPALLEDSGRHWRGHLAIALLLVAATWTFPTLARDWGWIGSHPSWSRVGHSAMYSLMMWGFVFGFLGLSLEYRRTESASWRYIADSSYWIYLVHLPLVVWLQIWMAHWPVSWVVKFPLINLIAFPILFLSYHFLVRSSFIGVQLNGRRYPFTRPLTPRNVGP